MACATSDSSRSGETLDNILHGIPSKMSRLRCLPSALPSSSSSLLLSEELLPESLLLEDFSCCAGCVQDTTQTNKMKRRNRSPLTKNYQRLQSMCTWLAALRALGGRPAPRPRLAAPPRPRRDGAPPFRFFPPPSSSSSVSSSSSSSCSSSSSLASRPRLGAERFRCGRDIDKARQSRGKSARERKVFFRPDMMTDG
jgi:hypothetical protein